MELKLRKLTNKEVSEMVSELNKVSCVATIRTKTERTDLNHNTMPNDWVMDAKSFLGVLAIMDIANNNQITLTLDEFEKDKDMHELTSKFANYIK